MLACRDRPGAQGLHLYLLAYWDWPNTPDKVEPCMKRYDRDWIWFEAWGRYLWQPDRDPSEDRRYWVEQLADIFGNEQAAVHLEKSLEIYRELARRTTDAYRYANTLQTGHRRIPIRGWKDDQPYYFHWVQMLPLYEEELTQFKERVANLAREQAAPRSRPGPKPAGVPFELLGEHAGRTEIAQRNPSLGPPG